MNTEVEGIGFLYKKGNLSDAFTLFKQITRATSHEGLEIINSEAFRCWKLGEKTAARKLWDFVINFNEDCKAREIDLARAHTGLSLCWAEEFNRKEVMKHAKPILSFSYKEVTIEDTANLDDCATAIARIEELERKSRIFKTAAELKRPTGKSSENFVDLDELDKLTAKLFKKVIKLNGTLIDSGDAKIKKKATCQLGNNYHNMALFLHIPQRNWDEAFLKLKKAIFYYKEVSADRKAAIAYRDLAIALEGTGHLKEALENANCSYKLLKKYKKDSFKHFSFAQTHIARITDKILKQ